MFTAQKMKFFITDLFSKCDQIRTKLADLMKFTEEIPNENLHFLCAVIHVGVSWACLRPCQISMTELFYGIR